MDVKEKLVEQAISHFWYGVSHDIFSEPVTTYAKLAIEALKKENGATLQEWISVDERLPENFISVLGYMTDAGEFPPVRECYTVGTAFFFPALGDVHPVSHWCEMPQPTKGE